MSAVWGWEIHFRRESREAKEGATGSERPGYAWRLEHLGLAGEGGFPFLGPGDDRSTYTVRKRRLCLRKSLHNEGRHLDNCRS